MKQSKKAFKEDLSLPSPCCHCSVVTAYLRGDPCFLHAAQHTLCTLQDKKRRQEESGEDKKKEENSW
jgi:hypothetical protein